MTTASNPVALVESLDNELDELRRDADRYRVLREQWVKIDDATVVHRAGGLDEWCDKRLAEKAKPTDCA